MIDRMKKIAKILDIELYQEFCVKEDSTKYTYKLTKNGLISRCDMNSEWGCAPDMLAELITGKALIARAPWRPNYNEYYYVPDIEISKKFVTCLWQKTEDDEYRYKHGFVFRTKEEAIDFSNWILEKIADARKDRI